MLRILLLLSAFYTSALSEESCGKTVTSEVKVKLVRDSLHQVRELIPDCREANEDAKACSKSSTAEAYLNLVIELLEGFQILGNKETTVCPKCPDPKVVRSSGPMDCQDILKSGQKKSGVYTIYPIDFEKGSRGIKVYCDMDTEGGGWTVFQRRGNYSTQTDFYRNWESYKNGFGTLERDFWLGNENIHTISNQAVYSLRIDAVNVNKEYRYGQQNFFLVSDEESGYTLYIEDFSGNATNDMLSQNKFKFSTMDRPHQGLYGSDLCAVLLHGAWWYPSTNSCGRFNLNGLYLPGIDNKHSNWHWAWTGERGLLSSEMKIRRRNFKTVQQ